MLELISKIQEFLWISIEDVRQEYMDRDLSKEVLVEPRTMTSTMSLIVRIKFKCRVGLHEDVEEVKGYVTLDAYRMFAMMYHVFEYRIGSAPSNESTSWQEPGYRLYNVYKDPRKPTDYQRRFGLLVGILTDILNQNFGGSVTERFQQIGRISTMVLSPRDSKLEVSAKRILRSGDLEWVNLKDYELGGVE